MGRGVLGRPGCWPGPGASCGVEAEVRNRSQEAARGDRCSLDGVWVWEQGSLRGLSRGIQAFPCAAFESVPTWQPKCVASRNWRLKNMMFS